MRKKLTVIIGILLIGYGFHSMGNIPGQASRLFKKHGHPGHVRSEYLQWYQRGVMMRSVLLGATGMLLLYSGLNLSAGKLKNQD